MSTAELKLDLINKITRLKETRIIEVSAMQKERLIQAKNDTVLSEEEANTDIEKWLQKK